jgi:hypothetical protein
MRLKIKNVLDLCIYFVLWATLRRYLNWTPWPLVRKRTIPTERPPLVGEVSANFLRIEGVMWSAQRIPTAVNIGFQDRSRYFSIQVALQLSSQGWVNSVPDPLLLRKSGSAGNRIRDLRICSQELWPLDHRGGHAINTWNIQSRMIGLRTSDEKGWIPKEAVTF